MQPGVSIIPVVFWSKSGLAAARPAATGLRNGSIWVSTDTKDIDQVQGGSWVTVLDYSVLAASVLTTRGDIIIRGASADIRLPKGTAGKVLIMGADEPDWGDIAVNYARLTVLYFQENPATGNFQMNPQYINNNLTDFDARANVINQYAEVLFNSAVRLTQFRQFGDSSNNGNGVWKIQYLNAAGAWVDWKTGISVRATDNWGGWDSSAGEVVASGIRLVCTTVDTAGSSYLTELEVKY